MNSGRLECRGLEVRSIWSPSAQTQEYKSYCRVKCMKTLPIFAGCLILLLLISSSYAASCAQKSYSTSCSKCKFSKDGKMDQTCYDNYQTSGKTCLFAAYLLESMEYTAGNCPAIDICVDRLQACKALYSSQNDQLDCETGSITNCFVQGDRCVAAAVKDCKGTPPDALLSDAPPASWCDGFFFMIIPLFVGVLTVRRNA